MARLAEALAWRHLECRIRVATMNGEPDNAPPMISRDRNAPIIDVIKKGDEPPVGVVDAHGGGRARPHGRCGVGQAARGARLEPASIRF